MTLKVSEKKELVELSLSEYRGDIYNFCISQKTIFGVICLLLGKIY